MPWGGRIGGVNIYEIAHGLIWPRLWIFDEAMAHTNVKASHWSTVYADIWTIPQLYFAVYFGPVRSNTPSVCLLQKSRGLSHLWYRDDICSSAMRKCTTFKLWGAKLAKLIWILLAEPISLSVKDRSFQRAGIISMGITAFLRDWLRALTKCTWYIQ